MAEAAERADWRASRSKRLQAALIPRVAYPLLVSEVAIAIGEPFEVASDVDDAGLEARRVALEATLADLEARAKALLASPSTNRRHDIGV
jgi:hypothetical protein